jgi:uncharacterized protein
MQRLSNGQFLFSPSDLTTFMKSPFASWMDRASKDDVNIRAYKDKEDALLVSLQGKGLEHESAFYQSLLSEHSEWTVCNIKDTSGDNTLLSIEQTKDAMQRGVNLIFQGCLTAGHFRGFSDFLVKVEGASSLGDYHYEVWDTKLSKSVKPYFLIQLCAYAEMLAHVQGVKPQQVKVVLGTGECVSFNTNDYYYSYLALKTRFLAMHNEFDLNNPPDPAHFAEWGDWTDYAKQSLIAKDHLIQVANISRSQIEKLNRADIYTLTALANTSLTSVPKLKDESLAKLKAQAAIQLETQQRFAMGETSPAYALLPIDPILPKGLALLPPPSSLDVFFDIEGDPMHERGLEYLWGATYFDEQGNRDFIDFWAHDHEQETMAFVSFIQWAYDRWQRDPQMHIYHYANYEIAACKRLMGRYGVCEHEVDQLLRNGVFIDLYAIVRHGLRVGEPRYSIKNIEHLYRGKRDTAVASGGDSVVVYEAWRESPDGLTWQTSSTLRNIRDYNKDDCDSTQELVVWLRALQSKHQIPYVGKAYDETASADDVNEVQAESEAMVAKLVARRDHLLPHDPVEAGIAELLSQLIEFHKREAKPMWWQLYERLAMDDDALYDDIACIANAKRTDTPAFKQGERDRNLCYEYEVDAEQEFKAPRIRSKGSKFHVLGLERQKVDMVSFDLETNRFLLKAKTEPDVQLTLIPDEFVNPTPIPEAIQAVANAYLSGESLGAIYRFLSRDASQSLGLLSEIADCEEPAKRLNLLDRLCLTLNNGFLAIQGPPGAGKTYTAKHVMISLLKAGKRIGVASNSHSAVVNLLKATLTTLQSSALKVDAYYTSETHQETLSPLGATFIANKDIASKLENRSAPLIVGTTAWGFAREELKSSFDYLFVDEAGQVSLANLVAMSQSSRNLVLLGDQMQLGQPLQGTHPEPSGLSVLEYLLGEHHTIPAEMGVFLGTTYRMHPDVNRYISQAFYDDRLLSAPQCAIQKVTLKQAHPLIKKESGIVYLPVEHVGNTQASSEEVTTIAQLVGDLIGSSFTDSDGMERIISLSDMLIIAPYNHQVTLLKQKLGKYAKVGSVDLFQGQEAPIVILSMCSSFADESARGVEFILDPNRLNVAISRAQALAIVVASKHLTDIQYSSEKVVKLVNNFEMLKEMALEGN